MNAAHLGRVFRKGGWGIGDQALSSLTNFAVGVEVARTAGAKDFGGFSLAFATYIVCLNVSRALGPEPLLVRYSGAAIPGWRRGTGSATGMAVCLGVVLGLGCGAVAITTQGAVRAAFLALALTLPGLLVQDVWRLAFFARGKGQWAFLNDLIWAVTLVPVLLALEVSGQATVFAVTLAWGGSASLAALIGGFQAGVLPQPSAGPAWLREHRDLAPRYLGEFVVLSGMTQLSSYAIGAVAGLSAVGSIRGSQVLLGPSYVFNYGVRLAVFPEAVRLLKRDAGRVRAVCLLMSVAFVATMLAWGLAIYLLPSSVGKAVLGPTWQAARRVLVPVTFAYASSGAILGASTGIRVLAAAQRGLRARIAASSTQLLAGLIGAGVAGAFGAAVGLAIGGWISVAFFWLYFEAALRHHAHDPLSREGLSSHVITTSG